MINIHSISLSFHNQHIFNDISLIINASDRIGLVGANGSGKTTFLKSILDPSLLDSGSITITSKKKIAYMPQDVVLQSNLSVADETFSVFADSYRLEKEVKELEKVLNTNSLEVLERYSHIQELLNNKPVEMLRAQTKKMLHGLGFSEAQLPTPVNSLSVGWKMRIVLAKLLLQEADFYLFDEPTNHLDLPAKEWFLHLLKNASFGFLLICHERYFLDELCEKTLELERGKAILYKGNYTHYREQKEHDLKILQEAYVQQQKEFERKQATIERFRASASKSRMALSMEKALEKIERIELPPSPRTMRFIFPSIPQSGKQVLSVHNLSYSFGDKRIFDQISFDIEKGQKVALIAPNGKGKTTLFNVISGMLSLQQGSITTGYNVQTALFAQDQNAVLNPELTVFENIQSLCPKVSDQMIRSFLGAFLFSGEDIHKKVKVLSGGEKNRVGMVDVLLQQANFLLLDEPTNHLDIPSKEILLKALQEFKGTLFFVSHDRDFVNALATVIIELTPHKAFVYEGNYDYYIYHKNYYTPHQEKHEKEVKAKDAVIRITEKKKEEKQKIRNIERDISQCESAIKRTEKSFETLEYGTNEFNQSAKKLEQLRKELINLEQEWESLHRPNE